MEASELRKMTEKAVTFLMSEAERLELEAREITWQAQRRRTMADELMAVREGLRALQHQGEAERG